MIKHYEVSYTVRHCYGSSFDTVYYNVHDEKLAKWFFNQDVEETLEYVRESIPDAKIVENDPKTEYDILSKSIVDSEGSEIHEIKLYIGVQEI